MWAKPWNYLHTTITSMHPGYCGTTQCTDEGSRTAALIVLGGNYDFHSPFIIVDKNILKGPVQSNQVGLSEAFNTNI